MAVGSTDSSFPAVAKADNWRGVKFFYALNVDPGVGAVAVETREWWFGSAIRPRSYSRSASAKGAFSCSPPALTTSPTISRSIPRLFPLSGADGALILRGQRTARRRTPGRCVSRPAQRQRTSPGCRSHRPRRQTSPHAQRGRYGAIVPTHRGRLLPAPACRWTPERSRREPGPEGIEPRHHSGRRDVPMEGQRNHGNFPGNISACSARQNTRETLVVRDAVRTSLSRSRIHPRQPLSRHPARRRVEFLHPQAIWGTAGWWHRLQPVWACARPSGCDSFSQNPSMFAGSSNGAMNGNCELALRRRMFPKPRHSVVHEVRSAQASRCDRGQNQRRRRLIANSNALSIARRRNHSASWPAAT